MMKRVNSRLSLALLLAFANISSLWADKKDFDARWKEGEQNVQSGSGQRYFDDVFFKEFYGKFAVHMTECARRTGEKMMADLHAAVELGSNGQVLSVIVSPETKPSKCFAELVKRDTFSRPPAGHFWIPVKVTFTGQ